MGSKQSADISLEHKVSKWPGFKTKATLSAAAGVIVGLGVYTASMISLDFFQSVNERRIEAQVELHAMTGKYQEEMDKAKANLDGLYNTELPGGSTILDQNPARIQEEFEKFSKRYKEIKEQNTFWKGINQTLTMAHYKAMANQPLTIKNDAAVEENLPSTLQKSGDFMRGLFGYKERHQNREKYIKAEQETRKDFESRFKALRKIIHIEADSQKTITALLDQITEYTRTAQLEREEQALYESMKKQLQSNPDVVIGFIEGRETAGDYEKYTSSAYQESQRKLEEATLELYEKVGDFMTLLKSSEEAREELMNYRALMREGLEEQIEILARTKNREIKAVEAQGIDIETLDEEIQAIKDEYTFEGYIRKSKYLSLLLGAVTFGLTYLTLNGLGKNNQTIIQTVYREKPDTEDETEA